MTRKGSRFAFSLLGSCSGSTFGSRFAGLTTWIVVVLIAQALVGADEQTSARATEAYNRAIQLESNGNDAGALSLLWEAAGLAPRDPDIQNRLGEALERVGALDAAIDAYRAATATRPSFRKASSNLILALVKAGRSPEAVELARAVVAAAPDDPDRHFMLGLAQTEQDVDEAIKSFRRAVELAPRHSLARYNLALVLKRADRLQDAIDELHRVIAIEPRAEAHYTLGVIYWHQGDLERAAAALRTAVSTQPRYAEAHYTLGAVLLARRDLSGAGDALRRALALQPDLTGAHYTMARVLQAAGDEEGARTHLSEAERLRQRAQLEHEARVWTAVGTEKLESGDLSSAVDCFRRATATFEAYAPAHYQMGRAFQRLGDVDAARSSFSRAQQLNPSLVPPRDIR
jgi:tetratricopeptide (TPR) repeat protein